MGMTANSTKTATVPAQTQPQPQPPAYVTALVYALVLADRQATRPDKPCRLCGAEWRSDMLFHFKWCAVYAIHDALALMAGQEV